MAVYRVEAWISHSEDAVEDELEERVLCAVRGAGLTFAAGPVAFRVYPAGDHGSPFQ